MLWCAIRVASSCSEAYTSASTRDGGSGTAPFDTCVIRARSSATGSTARVTVM